MAANGNARSSPDAQIGASNVELREDIPLKRGVSTRSSKISRCCEGGPRIIPGAFAVLTGCITVALLAQIYLGDYELVPHGSVASSAAACSGTGTDVLKAGGHALDAAAAAALCLAVVVPHRTSFDASGSMLYWEYREARTQQPVLYEWGGMVAPGDETDARPPRLVAALAHLHSRLGVLPWARILAPAIQLASDGFPVSEGLASMPGETWSVNSNATAPELARYLSTLLLNSSAELSNAWNSSSLVRQSPPVRVLAGDWRVLAGGAGAGAALSAMQAALEPPATTPKEAQLRVVSALQRQVLATAAGAAAEGAGGEVGSGVATGLAAVDARDTYVALVTGTSAPFGSGPDTAAGWRRDAPAAMPDVAPAMLLDAHVCGSRYVLGAESSAALAQAGVALAVSGAMSAVEGARVALLAGGGLALEAAREPLAPLPPVLPPLPTSNATPPYAAVNLVLQRGDALSSHADSRGGGLASRF